MGEIAHVDLDRLRHLAAGVSTAASEVADLRCPELHPDELRGSAVGAVVTSRRFRARLEEVGTAMREWAGAARRTADAFEHADTATGERIASR
ncbi:DUF7162 family protein [Mycolicibacterium pyrenivorans]|uniref:DUF7162 family protein n=1 Tax=Mycolicibacterium pyrenivorans TaxID=187102 RepID=UPI0021F3C347|nr:hypothetical protein [Mycolicibacterium pyrenivorans]MCV7150964.1 hypothetical protein [Mycolicibacterium pyrenivorans]